MSDLNLPDDLLADLRRGFQPEYDPASCDAGLVTLVALDQLKTQFFPMDPVGEDDPNAGKSGSYLVQGVSLIATCDGYDPAGLLLWLPLDGRYGVWDGDHGTLQVFAKM